MSTTTPAVADTTTQAPAAAAPAAPAVPSKMDKAKVVFDGLHDGSIPLTEGKATKRASFIATMQTEGYDMTPAGAATYWQNLTSKQKGGKLYPHTGKSGKKAEAGKPEEEKPEVPAEEPAAEGDAPVDEAPAEERAEDDVSHLA